MRCTSKVWMYGSLILQQDKLIYILILQRPFNAILFFVDWMNWQQILGLVTQKPSVQTFSRNCCWNAPKNSEERLGPCWNDVWFQDSIFTDERAMNKNENKKVFLRAIQLSYTKWFWYVWLVSILDHQAFASYNSPAKKLSFVFCLHSILQGDLWDQ